MSWETVQNPQCPERFARYAWARGADGQLWLFWQGESYPIDAAALARARALHPHADPSPGVCATAVAARATPAPGAPQRPHAPLEPSGPGLVGMATVVRAPTAGRVSEVKVAEGQKVAENEVVLVLEAMKVEVAVRAPQAGVVGRITCVQGSWVEPAEALMGLA